MIPETFARLYSALTNPDVIILSGDDALTIPMMSVGAKGVISVANNIIPKEIAEMCNHALEGRFDEALKIHDKYWKLFKTLFIETNPIPVKTAAYLMGLIKDLELRLPMYYMSKEHENQLKEVLKEYNLIS